MTQDEIIRMAREAGFSERDAMGRPAFLGNSYDLERFAALVAAHERNRHAWTQEHWTEYEHAIAAAEREACAKLVETTHSVGLQSIREACATAIRARGEK